MQTFYHTHSLQVQAGGEHNVPLHELDGLRKLVLELRVANVLGRLHHLPEQLLQSPHAPDDAPWKTK